MTNVFGHQTQSPAFNQQPQAQASASHVPQQSQTPTDGIVDYAALGARTLAEIEAEMRAQAQRAREMKLQEQQLLLKQQQQQQIQQQQQLLQQQQQLLKPPRLRSQSPSVHRNVPLSAPQAGHPHILGNHRQQHGVAQDIESPRVHDVHRAYQREHTTYNLQESQNRTHTPVDPVEFMLQRTVERERVLPHSLTHGRVPSRELQQQPRLDELEYQEQERRSRLSHGLGPANIDELQEQTNLRRQILADQQRQAQLVAAGIFDQRRDSPMDQLHHQLRLQAMNELVNKARVENAPHILSANPAELSQLQVQMQQRLLAQLAQQEFSQTMAGANGVNGQDVASSVAMTEVQREQLRLEAMRKIMEAERQEARRRRKAQKIAHMVGLFHYLSLLKLSI